MTPEPRAAATDFSPEPAPLALYLHWPFCLSKCPYCDFNSHVRERLDQGRWRRAFLREIDHYAQRLATRRLTSIFFGGGTPSLMDPQTVAAVVERATHHWPAQPNLEVTLEANPSSSDAGRFAAYAAAGVNRLSLGVQALDDTALKFLGRGHSAAEALSAIADARRSVSRLSIDLIYARPGQGRAAWRRELDRALEERPEHISLYQLTVEPGTQFHALRRRGELTEMPDDEAATLFEETRARLAAAGLPAYEVSNHARPGAECRHNLVYWRSGDYLGVGPGAHGRLTVDGQRLALRQHRAPEAWLERCETDGHATRGETPLTDRERLQEMVMMGLRLGEGIPRKVFRRTFAAEPESLLPGERLRHLLDAELITLDETGLAVTDAGFTRLDGLLSYLVG
jgi:oxygen-independent coproporphyrinogen-3 oxidase